MLRIFSLPSSWGSSNQRQRAEGVAIITFIDINISQCSGNVRFLCVLGTKLTKGKEPNPSQKTKGGSTWWIVIRWVRSLITKHWVPPLLLRPSPQVGGWSSDRCQDLCAFAMGNISNPWCPRLMQFLVNVENWQVIYQSVGPGFGFNQGPKSRVCACFSNPKMTQSWSSGARKDFEDKLVPDLPFTDEFLGLLKFAQQNEWQSWDQNVVSWLQARGSSPSPPASTYLE